MFLFGSNKLVALDIGTSSIKLAEIDQTSRGPILRKFGVYPLNPGIVDGGEIQDVGGVGQAIESLLKIAKSKRKQAVTGMWGNSVIVKKIAMPKMEPKLVAEQIKWEAEQYIPFDVNEISLEHHILEGGAENMDVLLVAAKQEYLFRFLECLESGGLKCAIMDVAGFALANVFELNYGKLDGAVALLNIGAGLTNFVIVEKGQVIFCRDINVGGTIYTNEIAKGMGVSPEEAESLKVSASMGQAVPDEVNSIIAATTEQVIQEFQNSFEFYAATAGGSPITKLFVSGGSIYLPGLVEQIAQTTGLPFEMINSFSKLQYDQKAFTPDYIEQIKAISPVVLGLALRRKTD